MSTGPHPPEPPYDPNRTGQSQNGPSSPEAPPASGYGQPPQPGHPPIPPPAGGYSPGRTAMRPDEEKLWAIGAHLGPIVLGFIAPLVVWLVFKDRSGFLDRTGKEALNMQISYVLYFFVAGISIFLLIGIVLLPLVGLAWFVLMIVAAVKVANFEDYRYPAIIRFIR